MPCLQIGTHNNVKMSFLLKLSYRFNAISVKITAGFLLQKSARSFSVSYRNTNYLEQTKQLGKKRLNLDDQEYDFRTYYKLQQSIQCDDGVRMNRLMRQNRDYRNRHTCTRSFIKGSKSISQRKNTILILYENN